MTQTHDDNTMRDLKNKMRQSTAKKMRSQSEQERRSFDHSVKSGGYRFSPINSDGVVSQKSKHSRDSRRSGMTRNPLHFEQNVHQHVVPGIDDRESKIYREFDIQGRVNSSF